MSDNPTGGELPKWKAKDQAKVSPKILADMVKDIAEVSPTLAALLLAQPIDEQPKRRARRGRR